MAALEQRMELVGRRHRFLPFIAFDEQVQKEADGRAAETVADEIGLDPFPVFIEFAPAVEHAFEGLSVPAVAAAFRVCDTVVDRTAFEQSVQFTAAVPETGERADVR